MQNLRMETFSCGTYSFIADGKCSRIYGGYSSCLSFAPPMSIKLKLNNTNENNFGIYNIISNNGSNQTNIVVTNIFKHQYSKLHYPCYDLLFHYNTKFAMNEKMSTHMANNKNNLFKNKFNPNMIISGY